jgi:hypothetical protein
MLLPFSQRAGLYSKLHVRFGRQTGFFAAAAATNAALTEFCSLPRFVYWQGGAAVGFLAAVGARLEHLNQRFAHDLEQGITQRVDLDDFLVVTEQIELEAILRDHARSKPDQHSRIVLQVNRLLLLAGLGLLASTRRPYARLYQKVLSRVRDSLGRSADFTRLEDRIAIGQTLTRMLRQREGQLPSLSQIDRSPSPAGFAKS